MRSTPEMVTAEARIAQDQPLAGLVSWTVWIPALAATMAYPIAVNLFVDSYHAAKVGSAAWSLSAIAALAVRRLLHLAVAVPPLYLLSGRVSGLLSPLFGKAASAPILWWGIWLALAVLVWIGGPGRAGSEPRPAQTAGDGSQQRSMALSTVRVRNIHRTAVI